jgi:hypothetical protein
MIQTLSTVIPSEVSDEGRSAIKECSHVFDVVGPPSLCGEPIEKDLLRDFGAIEEAKDC